MTKAWDSRCMKSIIGCLINAFAHANWIWQIPVRVSWYSHWRHGNLIFPYILGCLRHWHHFQKGYTSRPWDIECTNPMWWSVSNLFHIVSKVGNLQLHSLGRAIYCIGGFELEPNNIMEAMMLKAELLPYHGVRYRVHEIEYWVSHRCLAHENWLWQIALEVYWYTNWPYGTMIFWCIIRCWRYCHPCKKRYASTACISYLPILFVGPSATPLPRQ